MWERMLRQNFGVRSGARLFVPKYMYIPVKKKAERSQLKIDRLRLTSLADFPVEHYFCMIFRFPLMEPPNLMSAGRSPCMR